MNVYSMDIRIVGTAYVKAENEREARRKVRELRLSGLEVGGDEMISGRPYDHPDLPEVSLSPAMTIHLPVRGSLKRVTELHPPAKAVEDGGEGAAMQDIHPGDGTTHRPHLGSCPLAAPDGTCAFCCGDPCAEDGDDTRIAEYYRRNPRAETCPVCEGRPT